MEAISDWDMDTKVHDSDKIAANQFSDALEFEAGEDEGRTFGPQRYWRLIAHMRHAERPEPERDRWINRFLEGVLRGIADRVGA